jgi:VanZ family protein
MMEQKDNRRADAVPARLLLHASVLLVSLGLWTWKLLDPDPVPDDLKPQLVDEVGFIVAKSLHVCAYAFLAFLIVTLPVARRWRWLFVGLIALHGIATEIGQTFVPGRSGQVSDVLIDWVGITLGVLVWRAFVWWRGERRGIQESEKS